MLHTSNPIIKHKAGLLNLSEELGNVSKAYKVMGCIKRHFLSLSRVSSNCRQIALTHYVLLPISISTD